MRTATAPHEPTAWMRQAVAARQAAVDAQVHDEDPVTLTVVTPIGDWSAAAITGTVEDRTCDRCRVYVPPTRRGRPFRFFTGAMPLRREDGLTTLVVFGLCLRCAEAEGAVV